MKNQIIVISPEHLVREQVGAILEAAGHDVSQAMEHDAGIEQASGQRFDLVILHIGKADASGFQVFAKASLKLRRHAIIVLADSYDEAASFESLRLGAQDFLGLDELDREHLVGCARHAVERQRHVTARLASLASNLLHAEERERGRFALELSNQIGANLASASAKLDAIAGKGSPHGVRRQAVQARNLVDGAIQYTRSLTYGLSSPLLHESGLGTAIAWLLDEHRKCHDMSFELHEDRRPKPLSEGTSEILYQAARELLANAIKHARARKVVVHLESIDGEIRLSVEDDGTGLDTALLDRLPGYGLFSIRERIELMGGRLTIESSPSAGTRVTVFAPLERSP